MRIGVNLMFLVPGEVGGSEPLLTRLVESISDLDHELVVFATSGFASAYPQIAERTRIVQVPWSSGAQGLRIAAENSWLAWKARSLKLDVIHHGVGTTPFFKTIPTVVTIHDIQYLHHPENFVKLKRKWLEINVPHSARRCEVICVPSNWVKLDIVRAFGISVDKVAVVPFGSEGLFGVDGGAGVSSVTAKYRLERPFFLFPGRAYPHKSHRFLLEAYKPLAPFADLVFTGPPWFRDREIATAARGLGLSGKVRHLGIVSREDLGGLYRAATALVYPTRFEGFGLPLLEAMSVGCCVIASNVTSIPEVVAESGILLEPDDLEGWTETMDKVLGDEALRAELSLRGLRRAADFTWENAARLQVAAYQQAKRP